MTKDKIRVLIVDDEERFRSTTAAILNNRGFHTKTAGDGLTAIEMVRKEDFEVVVLDVKMPGIDGNEALREIKRFKPGIRVIMLTGHGTPESAVTGLRDGAVEYLFKPCHIDVIAQKIKDAAISRQGVAQAEHKVRDIMIPLTDYSTIREDRTVAEAIEVFAESLSRVRATSMLQEGMHRSILVVGPQEAIIGILSFTDLLKSLQPAYVKKPKGRAPGDTDYLFAEHYPGMFTLMARETARRTVAEIMSEVPTTIDAHADLMEAVNRLLTFNVRRLLVLDDGTPVGVLREQDLIFQVADVVRKEKS